MKLALKITAAVVAASLTMAFIVVLASTTTAALLESQNPVQTYSTMVTLLTPLVYGGYAFAYQFFLKLFRIRLGIIHAMMALLFSTVAYIGGVGLLFLIGRENWVSVPALVGLAAATGSTMWLLRREQRLAAAREAETVGKGKGKGERVSERGVVLDGPSADQPGADTLQALMNNRNRKRKRKK